MCITTPQLIYNYPEFAINKLKIFILQDNRIFINWLYSPDMQIKHSKTHYKMDKELNYRNQKPIIDKLINITLSELALFDGRRLEPVVESRCRLIG